MKGCYFVEPLDVLFLRGNKLFGEAGSYGESQIPPNPSVIAGAVRSALMAHKRIDFQAFATNLLTDEEFGSAEQPGPFRVTAFHLAQRDKDQQVEPIYPLPADLSVHQSKDTSKLSTRRLTPCRLTTPMMTSAATECLAVLPESNRGKPEAGFWLSADGWHSHLLDSDIDPDKHLVATNDMWQMELRTGIGLDTTRRSVETGKLFTVQALSLGKREQGKGHDIGFLAQIEGAELPDTLTLRLGGDGRAARACLVHDADLYEPDWDRICKDRRCRIILTSPGIFDDGWQPTGVTGNGANLRFELGNVSARLVCAAVPRAEVISGWDLAKRQPKPAQRVAPAGSVYWLEDLEATPEQLRKLADRGLWQDSGNNSSRQAEGYNRFTFAAY